MTQREFNLISTDELVEKTRTRRNYWAKLRHYGGGPVYVKLGRRVFYDFDMVQAWLTARLRKSTSDNPEIVRARLARRAAKAAAVANPTQNEAA
jgi:hypothetical protein